MSQSVQSDKNKLVVVKHNDLVEAAQQLTVLESRIVLTCISKINSKGSLSIEDKFVLSVSDIADLVGVNANHSYDELKQAVDRLAERWVYFTRPSKRYKVAKTRWVSFIGYMQREGAIELRFAYDILPFLSNLSRNFTQYKIENVLRFRSCYSVRLYELFCSWGKSERIVEIEWLRINLQLGDKYDRIDNFKEHVLDKPIADINKFSNMRVSYELIKRGRKVSAIKFMYSIIENLNNDLPIELTSTDKTDKYDGERIFGILKSDIERLALSGEDWYPAAIRLKSEQSMLRMQGEQLTLDVKW